MKRFATYLGVLFQVFVLSSLPVFAADTPQSLITGGLTQSNTEVGYSTSLTIPILAGRLISAVIGLLGIIFIAMIIQAGIIYMTAAGDGKKVGEAKTKIINAVIGLVIVVAAYALTSFIISQLAIATA